MTDEERGGRPTLDALRALSARGWTVRTLPSRRPLPPVVRSRYAWLPESIVELVESVDVAHSADDKTWLLAVGDFSGETSSAFAWDEWERLSLDATEEPAAREAITSFWSDHFPIFSSVRSGYAYLAVERGALSVVEGSEPEFEECRVVAPSLLELLRTMGTSSPASTRWA